MSPFSLQGKVALVTGSASGIGAGVARGLAAAGAQIVVADIQREQGQRSVEELRAAGHSATFAELDVTDDEQWDAAVQSALEEHGSLDVVVNNAGLLKLTLFSNLEASEIRAISDVNLVGTALGIKHAIRAMRPGGPAGGGGAIVNISSISALTAIPGAAIYSATKSAIERLTRVAAAETAYFDYGIRVNCVFPGSVNTRMGSQVTEDMVKLGLSPDVRSAQERLRQMTPLKRSAELDDVANAVVFLASDAASYITGVGLPVAGGRGM